MKRYHKTLWKSALSPLYLKLWLVTPVPTLHAKWKGKCWVLSTIVDTKFLDIFFIKIFLFFCLSKKNERKSWLSNLFSDKKIHYFSCKCRSSEVFSFLLSSVVYVFFYIEKYFRYFSTNTFVSQCLLNHLKNLLENQFLQ